MAKKKNKKTEKEGKKESLFDKQVDIVKSKFGDKVLQSMQEVSEKPALSYSTGSLGLDYLISAEAGGMPLGYVLEMYGGFSTGKTTLALGYCANVTANGKRVIFVDAERSLKDKLVVNAGVNKDKIHRLKTNDMNASINIMSTLMKTGEVGAVVIDSITAWKPSKQAKRGEVIDYSNSQFGIHAKVLAEVLPDLVDLCCETETTLILLNQARTNIKGRGGEMAWGGKAQEHYNTVRIYLRGKVKYETSRIYHPSTDEIIGQYVDCKCDKNKYDIPMKETKIPLILGHGVYPYMELAYLAPEKTDLIIKGGGGWYKWADTGNSIAHGENDLAQKLYEDKDLYKEIEEKVIEALGLNYPKDNIRINPYINGKGEFMDIDGNIH